MQYLWPLRLAHDSIIRKSSPCIQLQSTRRHAGNSKDLAYSCRSWRRRYCLHCAEAFRSKLDSCVETTHDETTKLGRLFQGTTSAEHECAVYSFVWSGGKQNRMSFADHATRMLNYVMFNSHPRSICTHLFDDSTWSLRIMKVEREPWCMSPAASDIRIHADFWYLYNTPPWRWPLMQWYSDWQCWLYWCLCSLRRQAENKLCVMEALFTRELVAARD